MSKFSLNDLLNDQSKKQEQKEAQDMPAFAIRQIPIEKIVPSAGNKYGIRDIEELAANIESVGLLHNLVVREANADGMYEIISGERRFRACKMLYESGNQGFTTLPCKVEDGENNALAELKLIFANATARELTDYEKTYQAGRTKELMQQLKAEGYKFKGRLREIVAEMFKVSPAQMGRMESINEHLIPEIKEEFKGGTIGITAAYELSTLPEAEQTAAVDKVKEIGNAVTETIAAKKKTARQLTQEHFAERECQYGGLCSNAENMASFVKNGCLEGCAGCCEMCRKKNECEKACTYIPRESVPDQVQREPGEALPKPEAVAEQAAEVASPEKHLPEGMTNADYIRSMTDEALANLLSESWNKADYEPDDYDPFIYVWLQQPVNAKDGLKGIYREEE